VNPCGSSVSNLCSSKGVATLLFINVSPTKTFTRQQKGASTVWRFGAGDGTKPQWNGLDSQHLRLNGKPLLPTRSPYALPNLEKLGAALGAGELQLPPLTITFVRRDKVAQCM